MLQQTVKELFQQEFDISSLDEKIDLAEQISLCFLKKIENQSTNKLKLVCSKQKCQFNIKLEFSPIENKFRLRDIYSEHNHNISQDKFEEKMLTSRLLKYTDIIYKLYFLNESEISSKPKLILKDLKTKHNLDVLSGNYTATQKQKLKKKFDNIVQQLRLKKNRSLGTETPVNQTTTQLVSTAVLPSFIPSSCDNGLSSSLHLPSIPIQQVKRTISNSLIGNRETTLSLSTAINSIGDSSNKSLQKRFTYGSLSNIDFQIQDNMNQMSVNSSQNNLSTSQLLAAQKNNLTFGLNNIPGFTNPNFSIKFLQQKQLMQQQSQQNQILQQQLPELKQISQQVISEDSHSASFCKVEDAGDLPSDPLQPRKIIKSQNNQTLQSSINNNSSFISQNTLIQQQQNQRFPLQPNFEINTLQVNSLIPQIQPQTQQSEQQFIMKLHQNQIQQEQMKQEELQLKNLINQQRRIQQQQQLQAFNPFTQQMFQPALSLLPNQQNIMQNPQQLMNLQLLLQNQQAPSTPSVKISQETPLNMIIQNPSFNSFNQSHIQAANLLQKFPEQQNLLLLNSNLNTANSMRTLQPTYFAPSGLIPTSSS